MRQPDEEQLIQLHPEEAIDADDSAPPPPAPAAGSAGEFRSELMMRPKATAPKAGWRRTVFDLTRGAINPGPSPDEMRWRQLLAQINTPLQGRSARRIAVLSRKGGISKTTTTVMLGHVLASVRGDRVIAVDTNPDHGSLADRAGPREHRSTVSEVLAQADEITHYHQIRQFTNQAPSRLEVLASNNDPHLVSALGESEYSRIMEVLLHHYSLILCDTGTGILSSAVQGVLRMADQLVLCAAPSMDSRVSAGTLDWLDANGYGELVRESVVVISAVRQDSLLDLAALQAHFGRRCRAVIQIPWDRHLAAGAEASIDDLAPATRRAYFELAAAVAAGFNTPGGTQ